MSVYSWLMRVLLLIIAVLWPARIGIVSADGGGAPKQSEEERVENITKAPNDTRLYRGLKLKNDMKVFLVSDDSATTSAVSMVVRVGALNDPEDTPGLANLLAYLVLTRINFHLEKMLKDHDVRKSTTNPCSLSRHIFSFAIKSSHLFPALEKFAQIFHNTLFEEVSKDVLEDAVEFVQQEWEYRRRDDFSRMKLVERQLLNETNHPYGRAFCGNKETLYQLKKITSNLTDLSRRTDALLHIVQKFHSKWYSSDIMHLVVLGNESLDELENYVTPLFEDIENKNVKLPIWRDHPLSTLQLQKKIYIVPKQNNRTLALAFPMKGFRHYYKFTPDGFVRYQLARKTPNSLAFFLWEKNLCDELQTESFETDGGVGFFYIMCELTANGLKNIDDIIVLIFQYIFILRQEGVQEKTYNEMKNINLITFMDETVETSPFDYVKSLAIALQYYPFEDIVSYGFLLDHWEPAVINKFLGCITPNNMNVYVMDKSFEKTAYQREPYSGARYAVEEISEELRKRLDNIDVSKTALKLPPPNEFIPDNLELYPLDENRQKKPYIIHESSISEIWFKQDDQFRVPKLHVWIEVFSSTSRLNLSTDFLFYVFSLLIKCSWTEYTNQSEWGGYSVIVNISSQNTLKIHIYGYNDKLPLLVKKLFSKISVSTLKNEVEEENFQFLREEFLRTVKYVSSTHQNFQIDSYLQLLMTESGWTEKEKCEAAKICQLANLEKFLSNWFSRVFVRVFVHGNCNKKVATDLADIFEETFRQTTQLLPQERLPPRSILLQPRVHFINQMFNENIDSHLYCAYFQISREKSVFNSVINALFEKAVLKTCVENLTDKTRNHYKADCFISEKYGIPGFMITTESARHPRHTDSKVEKFLRSIPQMLENVTDDTLQFYKSALKSEKSAKISTLNGLSENYWEEIMNGKSNKIETEIEILQSARITRADLLNFFREVLDESSPERRKVLLNVYPTPKRKKPGLLRIIPPGTTYIDDTTYFKSGSTLVPS